MKNIDTNLYSRQIKTYGMEAMSKLQKLRILIEGMKGLRIEISKNVILSGIKELKILDENICEINDLENDFFLRKISVKKEIFLLIKIKRIKFICYCWNIQRRFNWKYFKFWCYCNYRKNEWRFIISIGR